MANMTKADFQAMLARVIAKSKATPATTAAITEAAEELTKELDTREVEVVSLKELGVTDEHLKTEEGKEAVEEIIKEVISPANDAKARETGSAQNIQANTEKLVKDAGVTREITLNTEQLCSHDLILTGKSCVTCGAAGTGKTTLMRRVTRSLIDSGQIPKMEVATKWLAVGAPGIVILSFTRKATNNIRRAVVDELKNNTLTVHKVLEFAPEFYEIEDPSRPGFYRSTMRFLPGRNKANPLPSTIKVAIFEESSMLDCILYNLWKDATPHEVQEIFVGDIQQLPPVFGAAVLGYKMLELPVVELTEVYRQARESPILDCAWKLLEGNPHVFSGKTTSKLVFNEHVKKEVSRISAPALDLLSRQQIDPTTKEVNGELKFQIWQKQLSADHGLITCIKQFNQWESVGYYKPDDDIILCPFNKSFGTIELNKGIQQYLGRKRGAEIVAVIAGFDKHYLAVGDRVLFDKEDAFITAITRNGQYLGKSPATPSKNLDRWGHYQEEISKSEEANHAAEADMSPDDLELIMQAAAESFEDRVQAASHVITIRFAFSDEIAVLETAGEINNLLGGNAVTVHKYQGSENGRVFLVLHNSHATMISRELLYTGVTRAREFLHVICEPTTFYKGIQSQRIKGNTLAEKAEFFKGKQDGTIPVKSVNRECRINSTASSRHTSSTDKTNTDGQQQVVTKLPETAAEKLAALKLKMRRK